MSSIIKAKGFTLIELLVVIAIISLLASVVLASLSSVRKKAIDATRLQGIRSLQTAIVLYQNNNVGNFPLAIPDTNPAWGWANSYISPTTFMNNLIADGDLGGVVIDPVNLGQESFYYHKGNYGGFCSAPNDQAILHFYMRTPATAPYVACSEQNVNSSGLYGWCVCM